MRTCSGTRNWRSVAQFGLHDATLSPPQHAPFAFPLHPHPPCPQPSSRQFGQRLSPRPGRRAHLNKPQGLQKQRRDMASSRQSCLCIACRRRVRFWSTPLQTGKMALWGCRELCGHEPAALSEKNTTAEFRRVGRSFLTYSEASCDISPRFLLSLNARN